MKWINVNVELPEEYKEILVFTSEGTMFLAFREGNEYHLPDLYRTDITHWMILSTPTQNKSISDVNFL